MHGMYTGGGGGGGGGVDLCMPAPVFIRVCDYFQ